MMLNLMFAIDRAGLVGADGETHHGIYDIFMRYQILSDDPSNEEKCNCVKHRSKL